MDNPGVSLFQSTGIHIDSPLQNQEEDEDLEEQKKRQEEVLTCNNYLLLSLILNFRYITSLPTQWMSLTMTNKALSILQLICPSMKAVILKVI